MRFREEKMSDLEKTQPPPYPPLESKDGVKVDHDDDDPSHQSNPSEKIDPAETSIAVQKIEIMANQYQLVGKIVLFFFIFLVSYSYGLDNQIRYVYQANATNSYSQHSLLATINVVNAVIAAAAQPTMARLSDVFGRVEILILSVVFYCVGTIIESQATSVQKYAGAAVIYQIGYTGLMLTLQLLIADFSFLNWRLFCSFVPALPFIINTWISGDVSSRVGPVKNWSWGIAMWAIIVPIVSIPLIITLLHIRYRAKQTDEWKQLKDEKTEFQRLGFWKFLVHLFWILDVIGIILIIAVLALILVPFTLAGGLSKKWKQAHIIAPLVIGILCIPAFAAWEKLGARHPIVPEHLLKDRGIWSALIIGIFINFIWYMQGDYMYTILIVSVNESVKSATRITSLYSFVSVITGTILGLFITRIRYVKPFIVFGTVCWIVAMGLLVHFRGSDNSHSGIIGSLCFLGFGAGFFTYPTQASIQSCTRHEHMAVVTALYLASYNIGSAIGGAISGAIWSQKLPHEIAKRLPADLVATAYSSPFTFIIEYPWDTTERQLLVEAYRQVQRILCSVGTAMCVPLIVCALLLRNHKLNSVQSLNP